jgi:muramoyltetrapeptide carboxypeptidase
MLPKKLKKGDCIGIVSPSSFIKDKKKIYIENAAKKFKKLGLKVVFSKNCFNKDKFKISSDSAENRAKDINEMFSDKSIHAIYCSQGGETANQLLNLINFENIKKNPKIFLGMSDVDVLSYAIYSKTGLVTFNASDPKIGNGAYLDFNYSWESFIFRLFDKSRIIPRLRGRKCVRSGIAEGKIMGCNLISLTKLGGTEFFPDFKNKILFL